MSATPGPSRRSPPTVTGRSIAVGGGNTVSWWPMKQHAAAARALRGGDQVQAVGRRHELDLEPGLGRPSPPAACARAVDAGDVAGEGIDAAQLGEAVEEAVVHGG